MSKARPDPEELRFQETLQAVFGLRCAEFGPDLRALLRELYHSAREDGITSAMTGNVPPLQPGTRVEHFGQLQPGLFISNGFLRRNGHVRKILEVQTSSCVLDVDTGGTVGLPSAYGRAKFAQYGPYKVVAPIEEK